MKNILSGLLALAMLVALIPASVEARTTTFTPDAFKAAVQKGETVLLHYKSTW